MTRDGIFDQLNKIKKIIISGNVTDIEDRVVVNIFLESFKLTNIVIKNCTDFYFN